MTITRDGAHPPRLRLFQSDRLERLTTITPRAFAVTWTLVLMLAVYASWRTATLSTLIGLAFAGLLIWTLFEYAMHRFVFHMQLRSQLGKWVIFLTHGNHHVAPSDAYRNLMPPIVSLAILGSMWCAFLLVAGPPGSALFMGFAIGYVTYDMVHYACHQYPMRGPVLRRLRRHHMRHHFDGREGNYAITAIFWDRVFGTAVPAKRG